MTKEEFLKHGKEIGVELKDRVLKGRVIKDIVYHVDNCRILVTKTENDKYGYAVFQPEKEEPFYIAEADYLLTDLQKTTAHTGCPLLYPGAKSMIEKNLYGYFIEYYNDRFDNFLQLSLKAPDNVPVTVEQDSVPLDSDSIGRQCPTAIIGWYFDYNTVVVSVGAEAYLDKKTDKLIVKLGTAKLDENGLPRYEDMVNDAIKENKSRMMLGLPYYRNPRRVVEEKVIPQGHAILGDILRLFGLPVLDVPNCPLLEDALNGKDITKYLNENGTFELKDRPLLSESNYR